MRRVRPFFSEGFNEILKLLLLSVNPENGLGAVMERLHSGFEPYLMSRSALVHLVISGSSSVESLLT